MKLRAHALAALPLAGAYYLSQRSALLAGLAAAASVLVDLDHLPDYLWWRGGWRGAGRISSRPFMRQRVAAYRHRNPFLGAMLLAWALLPCLGAPAWLWALAVGWTYHMLWDLCTNGVGLPFYSFIHRARLGFERRLLKPRPPEL